MVRTTFALLGVATVAVLLTLVAPDTASGQTVPNQVTCIPAGGAAGQTSPGNCLDGNGFKQSIAVTCPTTAGGPNLGQALASITDRNGRSEEHTSELQSQSNLVCRLLL